MLWPRDWFRDGPQALAIRGSRWGIGDRSLSLDDTWRRWHRALLCSIGGALGTGACCTVVFSKPVSFSLAESMAQVWLSGVSALNISVARRWGAACWAGGTVTSGKTEVNRSISSDLLATLALSISLVFLASFLSLLFLKDRAWSLYTDRHVIAPAITIRIIAMVLPMAAPRSSVEVMLSGRGGGAWWCMITWPPVPPCPPAPRPPAAPDVDLLGPAEPPAPPATLWLLAVARSIVPFLNVLLVRSELAWWTLEVCVPPVLVR